MSPRKVKEISFVVRIGKVSRKAAAADTGKLSDTANSSLTVQSRSELAANSQPVVELAASLAANGCLEHTGRGATAAAPFDFTQSEIVMTPVCSSCVAAF